MKDEKGYFRTSDLGSYSKESLIHLHKEGQIYVTNNGRVKIEDDISKATKGSIRVKCHRELVGDQVKEETVADNIWEDIPGMEIASGGTVI